MHGQPVNQKRSSEIQISSVNDNYVPPNDDRYFTNGLSLEFSHILHSGTFIRKTLPVKSHKAILRFRIGQEIYTPSNINRSNTAEFDRPYAGYLYLQTAVDTYWKRVHNLHVALNLGVIGPRAAAGRVQKWWHKLIRNTEPLGWQYQIDNGPVINARVRYKRAWPLTHWSDVIVTPGLEAGTAFNNVSLGFTARAGKIDSLDRSALTGSRLTCASRVAGLYNREWFLFFGFNNTLVLHNTLIEGSVFHPSKSRHTEKTELYVRTLEAGVAYSTLSTTWMAVMHRLSPEVTNGDGHRYISIDLAVRF